jgi:hypothetical protein
VEAFYGGQSAGTALAQVLFGVINPSGVLPYTLVPSSYSRLVNMTDMRLRASPEDGYPGRTYRFYNDTVLWPFGFGLSYSTFRFKWLQQQLSSSISPSDFHNPTFIQQQLGVTVSNTGDRQGKKVVQLFVTTPGGYSSPLRSLTGMVKIDLEAGSSAVVRQ